MVLREDAAGRLGRARPIGEHRPDDIGRRLLLAFDALMRSTSPPRDDGMYSAFLVGARGESIVIDRSPAGTIMPAAVEVLRRVVDGGFHRPGTPDIVALASRMWRLLASRFWWAAGRPGSPVDVDTDLAGGASTGASLIEQPSTCRLVCSGAGSIGWGGTRAGAPRRWPKLCDVEEGAGAAGHGAQGQERARYRRA